MTTRAVHRFIFHLSLYLPLILNAQADSFAFHFENITTVQGLSNNEITCFYKDGAGFMWIGTKYGLNRFDGKHFEIFYHNAGNPNSISGNQIADIIQDKKGLIWIATKDGGLTSYNPHALDKKQFTQYSHNPNDINTIATNRLNCLYDYNEDYLLIGAETYPAIFFNKKTGKFSYWIQKPGFIWNATSIPFSPSSSIERPLVKNAGNWIHHIAKSGKDDIWISFLTSNVVCKLSNDTLHGIKWIGDDPLTIPDFYIKNDTIWCASWTNGIFIQTNSVTGNNDTIQGRVKKFAGLKDEVSHIAEYNDAWVIAASKKSGIWLVNKKTRKKIQYTSNLVNRTGLLSNNITALYKDNEGIWWIGTSAGISKYNPGLWQFTNWPVEKDLNKHFTAFNVWEDKKGNTRIFTSNGIYKKSPGEYNFKQYRFTLDGQSLSPTCVCEYAPGKFVMGTELSVYKYDPVAEKIEKLRDNNKPVNAALDSNGTLYNFFTYQVRSIISDTVDGHPLLLWAALGWGMGSYDLQKEYFDMFIAADSMPLGIRNNLTRKIIKDKSGNVWLATAEGLYRWHKSYPPKNAFDAYIHIPGDSNSLSNNDIQDIYADENNIIWLVTYGGGLNRFDGKKFEVFRSQHESSNAMFGIYPDKQNNLWIPSAKGFEVFNIKEKYFQHVEVPVPEWKLQLPAGIAAGSDGRFSYTAGNEFISFTPGNISFSTEFPTVYLTGFHLFMQNHMNGLMNGNAAFKYDENAFTFLFSAPQFTKATPVLYSYFLEGNDKNWSTGSEKEKAEYNNLVPGFYQFKVKVSNERGEWSNAFILASFSISKPFWNTWWFYCLCIIAIASGVYFFIRLRLKQLLKIQHIRNNIANDLHDEVGSALSTISLYTEIAKLKARDTAGIDDILEKISATSQEMQENMHHIVWSLQPRNDNFNQMLLHLKHYATENLQQKNIRASFSTDEKLNNLKLSQEQRKDLFLICKEALNNIIKYASCSSVSIVISKNSEKITLRITDNGKGFHTDAVMRGNGLQSMYQRAGNMKGVLKIFSSPGKGTTVLLEFPVY